jgi:death-on-curing protein
MEARYLTLAEALVIYEAAMLRSGQRPEAPRDLRLLESALARPRTAAFYDGRDLIGQAARLAVGISRSQAMVEGNKRLALAAMATFLNVNGVRFAGDSLDGAKLLESLADPAVSNTDADATFEHWLRPRCK